MTPRLPSYAVATALPPPILLHFACRPRLAPCADARPGPPSIQNNYLRSCTCPGSAVTAPEARDLVRGPSSSVASLCTPLHATSLLRSMSHCGLEARCDIRRLRTDLHIPSQRAHNPIAQKPTMSPTRSRFGVPRQRVIIHKPGDRQQAYQCLLTFRELAAAFQFQATSPRCDLRHAGDARGRRLLREPSPEPARGTRASRNALHVHRVGTAASRPRAESCRREKRGGAAPSASHSQSSLCNAAPQARRAAAGGTIQCGRGDVVSSCSFRSSTRR